MKAKVKSTGEVVEARRICQSSQGPIWEAEGSDYYEYELDFEMKELPKPPYDPDYWTRLEPQYAGMAMQGILGNQTYTKNLLETSTSAKDARDIIVDASMYLAHAFIQKLKEKEERK